MSAMDEQAIRAVVADWMSATQRGDIQAVLDLMTEDAIFLTPGQEPMDRAAFEAAARAQVARNLRIDGASDIREVQIEGNMALAWSRLSVTVTFADGSAVKRDGHTLTIFRKQGGKWRLARDANMLVRR
jgi:uncharacterized protein (TIGR02246 family)